MIAGLCHIATVTRAYREFTLFRKGAAKVFKIRDRTPGPVCGGPRIVVGKARHSGRDPRPGLCDNAATLRRARIDARVLDRLRRGFDRPELLAVFTRRRANDRRKPGRRNGPASFERLWPKVAADEKERDNIRRAIETGAPLKRLSARSNAIESAISETTARICHLEAVEAGGTARLPKPPRRPREVPSGDPKRRSATRKWSTPPTRTSPC